MTTNGGNGNGNAIAKDDPAPTATAFAREKVEASVRAISLETKSKMREHRDRVDNLLRRLDDSEQTVIQYLTAYGAFTQSVYDCQGIMSDVLDKLCKECDALPIPRTLEAPALPTAPQMADVAVARARRAAAAAINFESEKIANKFGSPPAA